MIFWNDFNIIRNQYMKCQKMDLNVLLTYYAIIYNMYTYEIDRLG